MSKKIISLLFVFLLILTMTACGEDNRLADIPSPSSEEVTVRPSPAPKKTEADYTEVEDAVQKLLDTSSGKLQTEYDALQNTVGDSFDGYMDSSEKIQDWYALCLSESQSFYQSLTEQAIEYYSLIAKNAKVDEDSWYDAMDDCYKLWDRATEDYYDAWNDLFDDAYDLFDDLLSDAYDTEDYDEVYDEWSDMYDLHSDTWSDLYDLHSDSWDDLYDLHSDIYDNFYDGDYDIEKLCAKLGKESKSSEKVRNSDEMSQEFLDAMDSYEAFFDEYVEFMKVYQDNPTDATLLTQYVEYMEKYQECVDAFEAWEDEDMTDAEMSYYTEVQLRVSKKLLEVA